MKKLIRTFGSRTRSSPPIFLSAPIVIRSHVHVTTNLPDLPSEILLQILSYCMMPVPLIQQAFWSPYITPQILLSSNNASVEPSKQRGEQVRMAKILSLVCRRTWSVFMPLVWSWFGCSNPVALMNLTNACEGERELGGYVQ